jgi:hypothetical protein
MNGIFTDKEKKLLFTNDIIMRKVQKNIQINY